MAATTRVRRPLTGSISRIWRWCTETGNRPRITAGPMFVDTVYPLIDTTASIKLFSPDGDQRLDSITIRQSSSTENLWEGEILDSQGNVVLTRFWKGQADDLVWDGRDADGNSVPDGLYAYRVSATDRALNSATAVVSDLRIDTRPTPGGVNAARRGFSPNGDGRFEEMPLNVYVDVTDGIERWSVAVLDGSGAAIRTFTGVSDQAVPATLVWDGRRENGGIAPDGVYSAQVQVSDP